MSQTEHQAEDYIKVNGFMGSVSVHVRNAFVAGYEASVVSQFEIAHNFADAKVALLTTISNIRLFFSFSCLKPHFKLQKLLKC